MSGYIILLCFATSAGLIYLSFKVLVSLPQHFRGKQWLIFNGKLLASLCLIPATCFGLLITLLGSISYYPHRTFDKADWKDVGQRYTMVDDLSKQAVGWNKERVIEMLGQPEYGKEGESFRYPTGDPPQLFGGADPFQIVVEFQNGKVSRCYIIET